MCYSAQVWSEFQKFVHVHGAIIDIREFVRLYGYRSVNPRVTIPRAIDRNFTDPQTDEGREIKALIERFNQDQLAKWEKELFKQKRRLGDAGRTLTVKETQKALKDQRVATGKIQQLLGWITDAKRTEPRERDSRIYPTSYALVMVLEDGHRVVKPMRYQCRISGWPAVFDRKYPGTYNARKDSLEKAWKPHFGKYHGLIVATAFYENVSRHALEHRELVPGEKEENVVLQFRPDPRHDMLIACLWSRSPVPGQPDLLSFAAITDEPPVEVAAAGHDRCIIPIKPGNIDAWLNPAGDLRAMYAILDDRDRPYYEHQIAA